MNDIPFNVPLIAIGGSAGSLDPLLTVLAKLTHEMAPCRLLVATHLNREAKSNLLTLLSKESAWPVEWVQDKMTLAPQVVYVVPPNYHAEWQEGQVSLIPGEADDPGPVPSIDHLFSSIGVALGARAIGVLLSGTGDDGSTGGRSLEQLGGHLMLQSPTSAEFEGMPNAAEEKGNPDRVASPQQLADEILYQLNRLSQPAQEADNSEDLRRILHLLARKSGTDFRQYKASTLQRRLAKRQEAIGATTLVRYYQYLQEHPEEIELLFQTLLIKVTEFFRDEASFEALKKVVETLIGNKRPGDSLRFWSVGCATGEEAYSLAILVDELLGQRRDVINVQIFATEIDPVALDHARLGRYRAEQVQSLSPERLSRYFIAEDDGGYCIRKSIRQMLLFSRHDITVDTPFVRLDLLVCRNLLIYFSPNTQREVLPVFHYALQEHGFLFLGRSENVSPFMDLFVKHDYPHKIFQRQEGAPIYTLRFTRFQQQTLTPKHSPSTYQEQPSSLMDWVHRTLIAHYPHPYAVVNDQMIIQETRGSLRPFVEIAEGRLSAHLLHIILPALHTELQAIFLQARRQGSPQNSRLLPLAPAEGRDQVRISVIPVQEGEYENHFFIVIFERVSWQATPLLDELAQEELVDLRIESLEEELAASREHLRTFTEELESSNEELQTLNEEVQSANEELKSSNEELETSNEELQSANEELQTANTELRHINEQLSEAESLLLDTQHRMTLERRIMAEGQKIAQYCHWVYAYDTQTVQTSPFFARTLKLKPDTEFKSLYQALALFPDATDRQRAEEAVGNRVPFAVSTELPTTEYRSQVMPIEAKGRLINYEPMPGDFEPPEDEPSYYIMMIRVKAEEGEHG